MINWNDDVRLAFMALVTSGLPLLNLTGFTNLDADAMAGITLFISNATLFLARLVPSKEKKENEAELTRLKTENNRLRDELSKPMPTRRRVAEGGAI